MLQDRAAMLKRLMREAGLPVMDSPSHIVPLLVAGAERCKAMSDRLLSEHGIYAQPINYPTVARGAERLRFTPSPAHSEAMMRELVDVLSRVWEEARLRYAA
jgi:5-aminolevulinate synthase